jgi:predicted O-methyltransferase YrrM
MGFPPVAQSFNDLMNRFLPGLSGKAAYIVKCALWASLMGREGLQGPNVLHLASGGRVDPQVQKVIDELQVRIAREAELFSKGQPADLNQLALAAGPETAGFLNLLIRTMGAKRIVEVGTSIGYTALWLGEAARATGGHVIGMEAIEAKHQQAVGHIARAGLSDVVEIRLGDAKKIVQELTGPIDLVFLDAWKDDYFAYFDALLPKLRVGGGIVADNITYPANFQETMRRYQEHVRSYPNVRSHLLSIGMGEEMSVRIG